MHTVNDNFKMQVWTGGITRGAGPSDKLTPFNALTGFYRCG